jgi:hypothetical protein
MNRIKKAGLSFLVGLSSSFISSCPYYYNPPPTPNPSPTSEVQGQIDSNNQHHIASFEVDNTSYDFYKHQNGKLGVIIDRPDFDYYLGLFQDTQGNPAWFQHPEGFVVKVQKFNNNNATVNIYGRGHNKELEIPREYVEGSIKNLEKLSTEEICDSIGSITRNGRLYSKFSGLIALGGCVASIVIDTGTFPSGEGLLGCAVSYARSAAITETLFEGAEKISEATLGCDFSERSLPDSNPEEMQQTSQPIPEINLPNPENWRYNFDNGHQYKLTQVGTWQQAEREAQNLGGYLVTINNSQENKWLVETFGNLGNGYTSFWIGYNDLVQEGNWEWVGEYSNYENWNPGEPNNDHGGEDCGTWFNRSAAFAPGLWNDMPCNTERPGIIERN